MLGRILLTYRLFSLMERTFDDESKRAAHGYYSYYYLNDRVTTQSELLDYLSKFGIKPEGYNVVMQGDITRIMEMNDTERRKIIDEIAGVGGTHLEQHSMIELAQRLPVQAPLQSHERVGPDEAVHADRRAVPQQLVEHPAGIHALIYQG
jgi:hypothetical protein